MITPEWEYWTPDPEIAEVLAASGGRPIDFSALPVDWEGRAAGRGCGFRFGRGRWDGYHFRLAPARPVRDEPRASVVTVYEGVCARCGRAHASPRRDWVYCGRTCARNGPTEAGREGRKPRPCAVCGYTFRPANAKTRRCPSCVTWRRHERLAEHLRCDGCGGWFRPVSHRSRYCSRACVVHAGAWRTLEDRHCLRCGVRFRPSRKTTTYCGLRCRPTGRKKTRAYRTCARPGCDALFYPLAARHRYCSMTCGGSAGGSVSAANRKAIGRPSIDVARAVALYQDGRPMAEIVRACGASHPASVRKALKRAGVTLRPPGNLSRRP